mmetsp:Transcript_83500/g.217428  ORF Transcript_83500/g.217428 Transcript_83500/m.217428 type:complete len:204 (+) Transcript_83500:435-1046(+)
MRSSGLSTAPPGTGSDSSREYIGNCSASPLAFALASASARPAALKVCGAPRRGRKRGASGGSSRASSARLKWKPSIGSTAVGTPCCFSQTSATASASVDFPAPGPPAIAHHHRPPAGNLLAASAARAASLAYVGCMAASGIDNVTLGDANMRSDSSTNSGNPTNNGNGLVKRRAPRSIMALSEDSQSSSGRNAEGIRAFPTEP